MNDLLHVENLCVEREGIILDQVNWRMKKGENWAVLGANGSGKTSLFNVLSGYLVPTSGSFGIEEAIYGETDWREVRHRIGIVGPSIKQNIEVSETTIDIVISGKYSMINYWGDLKSGDVRIARKHLKKVGCTGLDNREWGVLSEGERQRVLMARALMTGSRVLILDEPCAGLDPVSREDFLNLVREFACNPDAPGLVMVTHHVEEIIESFTHVLLLKEGRVVAAGPKSTVLTSRALSETFGGKLILRRLRNRYTLRLDSFGD
ncbi:MAG: ATP-binding cassette domain-containing protein [Opitutaceae bacterium]|nr:ATP-binding cassette domain-containing protein [Opitutaceae bacterium]